MNHITLYGKLADDAQSFLVNTGNGEVPMVSFSVLDFGLPNQKGDPMLVEVHFMKEIGQTLLPDMVKGKDVIVDGFLARKNYVTRSGESRTKYYVSASIVEFTGKCSERNAA